MRAFPRMVMPGLRSTGFGLTAGLNPGREGLRGDIPRLGELRDDEVEGAVLDTVLVDRAGHEQRGVVVLVVGVARLALDEELSGDRLADPLHLDVEVLGQARQVGGGDDRGELVPARLVRYHVSGVPVADRVVFTDVVTVPEVHQRARDGRALLVQDAAGQDDLRLVTGFQQVRALRGTQPEVRSLDLLRRLLQLARPRRRCLGHAWRLAGLHAWYAPVRDLTIPGLHLHRHGDLPSPPHTAPEQDSSPLCAPLRRYESQIRCDAICAPATREPNFAHATSGCVRLIVDAWAKPQSAPPMTFSGPTIPAKRSSRWATSRGCSTVVVWWVMTPGMRILPSGSFVRSHTSHSHSCREFAASMEYAPAFTCRMRSMSASSGASATCGTCQLPKQT